MSEPLPDDEKKALDMLVEQYLRGESCSATALATRLNWSTNRTREVLHKLEMRGLVNYTPAEDN